MDNVINLDGPDNIPRFTLEAEIADRVKQIMYEYDGRISLVSALGILELVKQELLINQRPS